MENSKELTEDLEEVPMTVRYTPGSRVKLVYVDTGVLELIEAGDREGERLDEDRLEGDWQVGNQGCQFSTSTRKGPVEFATVRLDVSADHPADRHPADHPGDISETPSCCCQYLVFLVKKDIQIAIPAATL